MSNQETHPEIMVPLEELTDPKCEFILTQVEKALQRTLDDKESNQKRCTLILGILSTGLFLCIKAVIDQHATLPPKILQFLIAESIVLALTSMQVILVFLPRLYAGHGYDPEKIITAENLNMQIEILKIRHARTLQKRIEINRKSNTASSNQLIRMFWLNALFLILWLFVFWFDKLFAA